MDILQKVKNKITILKDWENSTILLLLI